MMQMTANDFYVRLCERVSVGNARLLINSALVRLGHAPGEHQNEALGEEQVRALCMQLMSQGGPAFHVGQDVYRQLR